MKSQARADYDEISELESKSEHLQETIEENIEKLNSLSDANDILKNKIESLLPGATSIGLAKSFMERKEEYKIPRIGWTIGALLPIALIIPIGLFGSKGFLQIVHLESFNWQLVLEGILLRLPVVGPLVWLAIYSGRHHYLSSRLEEDYAYKEAISRSFEGYKREMKEVDSCSKSSEGLSTLCVNVLNTLSQSPGRLYDKKHKDFTPVNALIEALDEKFIERVAKISSVDKEVVSKVIGSLLGALKIRTS